MVLTTVAKSTGRSHATPQAFDDLRRNRYAGGGLAAGPDPGTKSHPDFLVAAIISVVDLARYHTSLLIPKARSSETYRE
jgi:hypothetical protein